MTDAEREAFLLPADQMVDLSPARRRYALSFLRLLGYEAPGLSDEQVADVFSRLARVEEYTTHRRHNGHNWEPDFAPPDRQQEAAVPVIETRVREWAERGLLTPIDGAPPRWPDGKRFALCLTHDVDSVSGSLLAYRARQLAAMGGAPWRAKGQVLFSLGREVLKKCSFRRAPDPALAEWMDIEGRHGFSSSFFFLAQPLPRPHWQDAFYRYTDRVQFGAQRMPLAQAMREMADGGWDVGLHGSSRSHRSAELLERERRMVSDVCGREVITTRQHHLFFDIRTTPLCQDRAGMQADSSLGSNIRSAFRCGTGLPFFLYDLIADRPLDVLEVPLVVQDIALFRVLQMNAEQVLGHCTRLLREAAELGGAVTFLWHNAYRPDGVEFGVYKALLEEADGLGAWGCSVRQLSDWWRGRARALECGQT